MEEIKILIVEDDPSVRNLISTTLKIHNYEYTIAVNAKEAIEKAISKKLDIVLLDLGLPDLDGQEVIKTIRSWSNIPIVVISARSEDSDKIDALDAGADDYLTKPFSVDELLARLRVIIRRLKIVKSNGSDSSVYQNGDLFIDYGAGIVKMKGTEIHLTPNEYKLLCILSKNTGKVLTHGYLMNQIWEHPIEEDKASLRVFMATLRKKIDSIESNFTYIQTHVGVGYRMVKKEG